MGMNALCAPSLYAGDVNSIIVGNHTNIQDNVVVHVAKHSMTGEAKPTQIGSNVTIGHGATVHACSIGDDCLVSILTHWAGHANL
jgi:gamma-carbonic anhydrase